MYVYSVLSPGSVLMYMCLGLTTWDWIMYYDLIIKPFKKSPYELVIYFKCCNCNIKVLSYDWERFI